MKWRYVIENGVCVDIIVKNMCKQKSFNQTHCVYNKQKYLHEYATVKIKYCNLHKVCAHNFLWKCLTRVYKFSYNLVHVG